MARCSAAVPPKTATGSRREGMDLRVPAALSRAARQASCRRECTVKCLPVVFFAIVALLLAGLALFGFSIIRRGFSARETPSRAEAFVARRIRRMAGPAGARQLRNPVPAGVETLARARAHFADHCATCHGNDGKGKTTIGQNLYPKPPDMSGAQTQSLSDGELLYTIKNGMRLSGMPAWGNDTADDDRDSWGLVHFIR